MHAFSVCHWPGNGSATAVQINPDTLATKSYGPIGPTHGENVTYSYSGGADDRYLYLASGKVPWFLVAYDRQEETWETWETLLKTDTPEGFVSLGQQANGVAGSAWGVQGTDGAYFTFSGSTMEK